MSERDQNELKIRIRLLKVQETGKALTSHDSRTWALNGHQTHFRTFQKS